MKHLTSRLLFAYWDKLRGPRAAPDRGEIEPGEIRHILADTFILEVTGGDSAEFRLAGTRLCALFGRELKGSSLASIWEEAEMEIARVIEAVTIDTAGVVAGLRATTAAGQTLPLEFLLLPLTHRGKTHSRILGAITPASPPVWIGLDPVEGLVTTSLRFLWPPRPAGFPDLAAAQARALQRRRELVLLKGGRP